MSENFAEPLSLDTISSYHAHIYFHGATDRALAAQLRERIAERFAVALGRWHEASVGPHSAPMYQVAFSRSLFSSFVPWLMLNRCGLSILVHPNTDDVFEDHFSHALWLGTPLTLHRRALEGAASEPVEAPIPNTTPIRTP